MSLVDKPFKEAIRGLPTRRLSWWADRRIKKMLRYRAAELDGKTIWADFFKQLVAVPMALVVLFTAVGSYGYASPSVVKGDLLYFVKTTIENARYPQDGSSEDRIAYHLWLSERRYDEVNEILSRLGKAPLVFIPVARAVESTGSTDDALNQILLETLQNATQQVDYAFLISDEIRDVERVKTVQLQIRTSLEKQKEFVKQVTPVLKEVKLQQKKKARVKRVKPVPVLEAPAPDMTDEVSSDNSSLIPDPVQIPDTALVSEDVQVEVENDQIDQNVQLSLENSSDLMVVQDEDDEVGDVGGFLEDRLSFQSALLQQIDEAVVQANTNGMVVVRLSVFVKPLRDEDEEISNEFFRRALSVHYEKSKKILESELQEFVVDAEVVPEPVLQDDEDIQEAPVVSEDAPVVSVGEDSSDNSDTSASDIVVDDLTPIALTEENDPEIMSDEQSVPDEVAVIDEPVPPLEPEVVSVTEVVSDPEVVSTVAPVSEAGLTAPSEVNAEPEPVKTACEIKAEEICVSSDRSDCIEEAVEKCEMEEKARLDREREQEKIRNMNEEVRKELQQIDLKMEQLKLNLRNSSPQSGKISDEMKASILKQEKDRKEEEKRKDENRKKEEELKKVQERKKNEAQKNNSIKSSEKKNQEGGQKRRNSDED
jgi:hypothetical protein